MQRIKVRKEAACKNDDFCYYYIGFRIEFYAMKTSVDEAGLKHYNKR